MKITPVEKIEKIFVKRDDLFEIAGVCGGKARSCYQLIRKKKPEGVVTTTSRMSPQGNIVASIAHLFKIPCYIHTPQGVLGYELQQAKKKNAIIIQHQAGYNNVIQYHAKKQALDFNLLEVPFGMVYADALPYIIEQVQNIPKNIKKIVVPVGSGFSFAGILHGLLKYQVKSEIIGISVGKDPTDILNQYAPKNWRDMGSIVKSRVNYHTEIDGFIGDLMLDPIYEAKCLPYLEPGDLLWVVGARSYVQEQNLLIN